VTGTEVTLSLDKRGRRLLRRLETLDSAALFALLDEVLEREGQLTAAHIVKTKLSGSPLKRRTGSLARSIVGVSARHQGFPALQIGVFRGPALAYANIQEHGGEIRPRKARALAFAPPGSPALTAAGVERHGGPRNYPGSLTFIPFKGVNAVGGLFDSVALKGVTSLRDITPVYLLLRRVFIKPKHYIRDGVMERLPAIAKAISKALVDLFADQKRFASR